MSEESKIIDTQFKNETKEVLFDQKINETILKSIDIFKYEYPQIKSDMWDEYKAKPNCKCRGKIFAEFKNNMDKFNSIMSKLMHEEIEIIFPGPLQETIVKEFDTITEMQDYLNELRRKGTLLKSASPSPNGKGGFVLICM